LQRIFLRSFFFAGESMEQVSINLHGEQGELLSVVVPAFNEEKSLAAFHERLCKVVDKIPMDSEIIYVNDGSTDHTLTVMERLRIVDQRVGILNLSRNFGKEIASTAGLDHAEGNAVILMDADLQHPPEMIPEFLNHWKQGHDVVYARRESRDGESRLKKTLVQAFYYLIRKVSRVEIPQGASDYRLLSRRAIEALSQCRERHRFMKGLFAWIGYPQKSVPYKPDPRYAGASKWTYWRLWTFALEGITSFTIAPLKIASYVGLIAAVSAFIHAAVIVYRKLAYGDPVAGFPSLIVVVSFLGGIQLLTMGVIGEYLGRMFEESKQRPLYIVEGYVPSGKSQSARQGPFPLYSANLNH
jgi:glycosyltransferase involved in cell wall biosynthesis